MSSVKIGEYHFSVNRQVSSETTIDQVFDGFPHGDIYPEFPGQLDRDMYEHTPKSADAPMGSHEIWETTPRHLRPVEIAKRARCSGRESIQLADALAVLDAGPQLSSEVCRWAYLKGVEPTLKYLHPFLVGVAQAEMGSPDPQDDEEPFGDQEIKNLEDMTVADLRRECAWREVKAPTRLRKWQLVNLLDRLDHAEAEPEQGEPATLGYHALSESDECDWIESQPAWFQDLISSIQEAQSMDVLADLGKRIYALKLSSNQAGVAWTFYKIRKTWLGRKTIVRQVTKTMVERIEKAEPAKLGGIGKILFQLQQGTRTGPKLNKKEWCLVWDAWHTRKAA